VPICYDCALCAGVQFSLLLRRAKQSASTTHHLLVCRQAGVLRAQCAPVALDQKAVQQHVHPARAARAYVTCVSHLGICEGRWILGTLQSCTAGPAAASDASEGACRTQHTMLTCRSAMTTSRASAWLCRRVSSSARVSSSRRRGYGPLGRRACGQVGHVQDACRCCTHGTCSMRVHHSNRCCKLVYDLLHMSN
jgi:hypothetical protein